MLVLIYDDFRADNEATVREVLRFLEVDDTLPVEPLRGQPDGAARARSALHELRARGLGRARARSR